MLPNEIILLVFIHLESKDLIQFTSTSYSFYFLRFDELFWRDLIQRKFKIGYCDPNQTWWNLLISGDVYKMCHHISLKHYYFNIELKNRIINQIMNSFRDETICLEPNCYNINQHQHSILLKLSSIHFIEIFCQDCNRFIGYSGQLTLSEKYISKKIIHSIIQQLPFSSELFQKRRLIEQNLFTIQNEKYTFLIEKTWFTHWIDFLIGV